MPAGDATGQVFTSWLNLTSVLGGVMAVIVCAFLAAVYLAADADAADSRSSRPLRRRALGQGRGRWVAVGGVIVLHATRRTCSTD